MIIFKMDYFGIWVIFYHYFASVIRFVLKEIHGSNGCLEKINTNTSVLVNFEEIRKLIKVKK